MEKYLRECFTKLGLNESEILLKIYERWLAIRYRTHWYRPITFRGSDFIVGKDYSIFPSLYFGQFEQQELEIILNLSLPDNPVIWDVGANIGIYSILLGQKFPNARILAFEPNEKVAALLQMNINQNALGNITLRREALSDSRRFDTLNVNLFKAGTGRLGIINKKLSLQQVQTIDGDSLISEGQLPPDFIKIDTEGHEPKVLTGLKSYITENKPIIMMEVYPTLWTNDERQNWQDILDVMFSIYGKALAVSRKGVIATLQLNAEELEKGLVTLIFGIRY